MHIEHSLERIVVVPRNGYVNRLQAWASANILGAELDVPVRVLWETEPVAPAGATLLFSDRLLHSSFIEPDVVTELAGTPHAALPRYLTVDRDRRLVVLAGHDQGEQAFMDRLGPALADECHPQTLLVIAGGKFHLPEATDFARDRAFFYSRVDWSDPITSRVHALAPVHSGYLGLHIRETDRSLTAPTPRAALDATTRLSEQLGLTSVFVCADTEHALERATDQLGQRGLAPWSADHSNLDRLDPASGQEAIVDWVLLGRSRALVYSAQSSFGQEAAVATGHDVDCVPLSASPTRQVLRAGATLARHGLARLGRAIGAPS